MHYGRVAASSSAATGAESKAGSKVVGVVAVLEAAAAEAAADAAASSLFLSLAYISPHALQSDFVPSGPRLHSGVTDEWHDVHHRDTSTGLLVATVPLYARFFGLYTNEFPTTLSCGWRGGRARRRFGASLSFVEDDASAPWDIFGEDSPSPASGMADGKNGMKESSGGSGTTELVSGMLHASGLLSVEGSARKVVSKQTPSLANENGVALTTNLHSRPLLFVC